MFPPSTSQVRDHGKDLLEFLQKPNEIVATGGGGGGAGNNAGAAPTGGNDIITPTMDYNSASQQVLDRMHEVNHVASF